MKIEETNKKITQIMKANNTNQQIMN